MSTRDQPSLGRMAQAFPVRTGIFTLGPIAIALAQLLNATIHGTAVLPVVAVAIVMCLFSVLVTRYHLAAFRRRRLATQFD